MAHGLVGMILIVWLGFQGHSRYIRLGRPSLWFSQPKLAQNNNNNDHYYYKYYHYYYYYQELGLGSLIRSSSEALSTSTRSTSSKHVPKSWTYTQLGRVLFASRTHRGKLAIA